MNASEQLIRLQDTLAVLYKKDEITPYDLQIRKMVEDCIETIEDLKATNNILKNLLYKIRRQSKKCSLCRENLYYRPLRNTTKQDIYESYVKIKEMVMGDYEFLTDENAIDEIIKEKKEYLTWI